MSLLIFCLPLFANGYNSTKTHPALADESVDLFNHIFNQSLISDLEKDLIKRGSTDEDKIPRPLHHFYNPITGKGLNGVASSVEWGFGSSIQGRFSMAVKSIVNIITGLGGDDYEFSFPRAVKDYKSGDLSRSFYSLGHVLHLIQDAAVPEHTRDDAHPPLHDSLSSPYEDEMAKWNPSNFDIYKTIKKEEIPFLEKPQNYLEEMAKYSNHYFFSEDTILSKDFENPKVISIENRNGALVAIGEDENGNPLPLAVLNSRVNRNLIYISSASLKDSRIGSQILDEYWSRLSRKALIFSVGLIRDFMTQVNRLEVASASSKEDKPEIVKKAQKKDTDKILTQNVSNPVSNVSIEKPAKNDDFKEYVAKYSRTGFVVINEIAWSGTTHSSSDEWIELYNNEDSTVDLSGWVLKSADESLNILFKEGTIIGPRSYFLIERSDDNTISNLNADLIASFGRGLSDSGEVLILKRYDGINLDFVDLKEGGGWLAGDKVKSMERTESNKPSSLSNWHSFNGATNSYKDASGGTIWGSPGYQNSVPPITTSPSPNSIIYNPPANHSNGGSSNQNNENNSVNNEDNNNSESEPQPELEIGDFGQIYISEIAWMGTAASGTDEWLELYNPSSTSFNLSGWKIVSETDGSPNIELTGFIEPFGYFLIERTNDETVSNVDADLVTSFGSGGLKNDGENIALLNPNNEVIDRVDSAAGWLAGSVDGYLSMERTNLNNLSSISWATYGGHGGPALDALGGPIFGTPGSQNCECYVDSEPEVYEPELPQFSLNNPWNMAGGNKYHTNQVVNGFSPSTNTFKKTWGISYSGSNIGQPIIGSNGYSWFGLDDSIKAVSIDGQEVISFDSPYSPPSIGAVSDEMAYFGHFDPGQFIYGISNNGEKVWEYQINDRVDRLTMADGNIYFSSEKGDLNAIDSNGDLLWSVNNNNVFNRAPIIIENQVIISGKSGNNFIIYSYDKNTGQLNWNTSFDGGCNCGVSDPSFDADSNKIYVVAGYYLLSINIDGSNIQSKLIETNGVGHLATNLTIGNDLMYVGYDVSNLGSDSNHRIIAINKADLSIVWHYNVPGILNPQMPVNGLDQLFFSTRNGLLRMLNNQGEMITYFEPGIPSLISPVLTEVGIVWGHNEEIMLLGD